VAEAKMKEEMGREKARQEAKEREEAEKKAAEEVKDKVEQEAQEQVEEKSQEDKDTLTEVVLVSAFVYDGTAQCLEYKQVMEEVFPVPSTMPTDTRISRKALEDLLKTLPNIGPPPPTLLGIRMSSEKTVINKGGDILCEEDVVLEESKEEAKSRGVASRLVEEREIEVLNVEKSMRRNEDVVLGRVTGESRQQGVEREEDRVVGSGVWAAVWQVEEKKMGIPDTGEDARRNEDVILKRKGERDRPRDMEEVGQRGVEDKGTKKSDEEQSKIREGRKTSKIQEKLTKKDRQRHIKKALQGTEDDDDTPMVRVVGDGTIGTKISGVEGRIVLWSPRELAIENAWIVCEEHYKGLRSVGLWWNPQEQHRQMVQELEKRGEQSKRACDLRRHLQSRRRYVAPQIGSALACFLSPLHVETKDWKEIKGVDEQEKG